MNQPWRPEDPHGRHDRQHWAARPAFGAFAGFAGAANQQLRIGDRERTESLQILAEHFAEGRLDREEYDERCDRVWAAKTGGDLAPVFADLPGQRPAVLAPLPAFGTAIAPVRPARPKSRVPFLPVLLVLIGLAVVFGAGWIVPLGIAAWLVFRNAGQRRRDDQTKGNRRP